MGKIFSLCPACHACPTIEIDIHEVRIGEGGNRVRLAFAEWNILVRAIRPASWEKCPPWRQRRPRRDRIRERLQSAWMRVVSQG